MQRPNLGNACIHLPQPSRSDRSHPSSRPVRLLLTVAATAPAAADACLRVFPHAVVSIRFAVHAFPVVCFIARYANTFAAKKSERRTVPYISADTTSPRASPPSIHHPVAASSPGISQCIVHCKTIRWRRAAFEAVPNK